VSTPKIFFEYTFQSTMKHDLVRPTELNPAESKKTSKRHTK
jgi:hypothetical protein